MINFPPSLHKNSLATDVPDYGRSESRSPRRTDLKVPTPARLILTFTYSMMGKKKIKKKKLLKVFTLLHDTDFFFYFYFFGMIAVACGKCELMNGWMEEWTIGGGIDLQGRVIASGQV